ncbi:MAG: aryl-sulfate sulfotransferase [marine benthic group bacterium]|nr:aryl-sulfate sulfotransferase [Gemmatimonadota bacterium]MCL7977814.1 aryl-sulfate sulfotransferase [Gemmatimonadota bacterium]
MPRTAARTTTLLLVVGALGACSDSTGPERLYFGSSVAVGPANVISGEAAVRATGYRFAFLRYTDGAGEVRESPLYPFGPDSTARPALLGLRPETSYEVEVVLSDPGELSVETLSLTTGTLPDWLPAVTPVGTDTTPGFLTLSVPDGPVIIDNSGRIVWYRYDPDQTLVNFQAHPAGTYTLYGLTNDVRAYRVLDELGRETGRIRCIGYETRPHEIRVLADGRALVMCDDLRPEDLSPFGGLPTAEVNWTVVQLLETDGTLAWEWHSADHFDVTDTSLNSLEDISVLNLTHGNSIDTDTDGNYLFSFRNLNEVTKVNARTGEVIWRFGGRRNQFAYIDDPKGTFERQHGIRAADAGEIQLLDNSDEAPSRFLRYRIDESARTATLVWQHIDAPETHTLVGGSTQVYSDRGGLVSFGREGRVVELDESGSRRWELTGIDGLYVFRAERIPSLYASERSQ